MKFSYRPQYEFRVSIMQNDGKEIPHFSDQKRLFFPFNIMHIVYVSFIYGFVSTFTSSAI